MIIVVLFDFGGVLAEEGFRKGLMHVGREMGMAPEEFFRIADELIASSGYLTGESSEEAYWCALRERTGITAGDADLREEILKRFTLRPRVLEYVKRVREEGFIAGILSDQTNWLDEINERTPFYHFFDHVFNSYKMKKSKRDSSVFIDVCDNLKRKPEEVLFVDDKIANISRALSSGMKALHFKDMGCFEKGIRKYLRIIMPVA